MTVLLHLETEAVLRMGSSKDVKSEPGDVATFCVNRDRDLWCHAIVSDVDDYGEALAVHDPSGKRCALRAVRAHDKTPIWKLSRLCAEKVAGVVWLECQGLKDAIALVSGIRADRDAPPP